MVISTLDSGSSNTSPGSSSEGDIVLCSWPRHLTLSVSLHLGVPLNGYRQI